MSSADQNYELLSKDPEKPTKWGYVWMILKLPESRVFTFKLIYLLHGSKTVFTQEKQRVLLLTEDEHQAFIDCSFTAICVYNSRSTLQEASWFCLYVHCWKPPKFEYHHPMHIKTDIAIFMLPQFVVINLKNTKTAYWNVLTMDTHLTACKNITNQTQSHFHALMIRLVQFGFSHFEKCD